MPSNSRDNHEREENVEREGNRKVWISEVDLGQAASTV